jgi:hypothetical protein
VPDEVGKGAACIAGGLSVPFPQHPVIVNALKLLVGQGVRLCYRCVP